MDGPQPPQTPFSEVLEDLDRLGGRGEDVRLGDVLALAGARVHGAAILLLALPEAIPLPVPSLSAVLGVPLVVISAHLMVFGERVALPARVLSWPVPGRFLGALAGRIAGPLSRVEAVTHTRLPQLANRERWVGAACLAMSALLLLPIPLMNVPPALALVLMSWGLVQRDGVFVLAGLLATSGVVLTLVLMVDMVLLWLG